MFLRVSATPANEASSVERAPPGTRLGERLGRGQVFAAERIGHPGQLAAKLFPWAAGLEPGVVREFTREALVVANLHHPHVVQTLDAGPCPDGTPFVLFQLLGGRTLEEHIGARGVMPFGEMIEIVRGITSALSAAHAVGVAHRELRTDNVFLADLAGYAYGFPKLLDFGASRLTAGARDAGRIVPERAGAAVAPEQRRDGIARGDARSDQFALAALAYRLLTGSHPPFGQPGGPAFERLWDRASRPWAARASELAAVEAVLQRAMSWRPEARFESVAAFFRALEGAVVAGSRPVPWTAPSDEPPPRRLLLTAPIATAPALEAPGADPSSLSHAFFAEGDRHEAALAAAAAEAGAARVPTPTPPRKRPPPAISTAFDRVPRRRAPLIVASVLALASVAAIAWSAARWFTANADAEEDEAHTTIEAPAPVR